VVVYPDKDLLGEAPVAFENFHSVVVKMAAGAVACETMAVPCDEVAWDNRGVFAPCHFATVAMQLVAAGLGTVAVDLSEEPCGLV